MNAFSGDDTFDISDFLKNVSTHPGVYRMYDDTKEIIYIGKAKNLHKRLNSYYSKSIKDIKTQTLVDRISYIEVTITPSEYEAYLLESTLIKRYKPRYNILFKDSKSYPYLALSHHRFPRLYGHRGKLKKQERYFGPYVSLASMRDSLMLLQKLFPVRQCTDNYFSSRTRPCLQYQIGRCSAPCVDKISKEDYALQVSLLASFIQGKFTLVLDEVSKQMHEYADSECYEEAAKLRDQLVLLTKLQQQQIVDQPFVESFHIIALLKVQAKASIVLLELQQGKIQADKHWVIDVAEEETEHDILQAFLAHYYLANEMRNLWPKEIILPKNYGIDAALKKSIEKQAGVHIKWTINAIKLKQKWQNLAEQNAKEKLLTALSTSKRFKSGFAKIQSWLSLDKLTRIECFDISHHQGEGTVASCVVYTPEGTLKSAYRHYNINHITPGDDYAAMAQAIERRVKSAIEQNSFPDVIIIDGGKGQLGVVEKVIKSLAVEDQVYLLSLGKGVERISGQESIYHGFTRKEEHLSEYDERFLLLRQIRDSAHDFAIKSQRKKLRKKQTQSVLESISGVGSKRRKALLMHFGGWQMLASASVDEIAKVQGISKKLADDIWHAFR
ncbi:excinuclease ABC subunit UvrC [Fangia hongkongensis]|uniref:excinuclease ABC subunit UvrC n=1 Tax=Fangia hongkongensis TaxID=270495 RepID=UPI000371E953|nr:excinuclease ABC subunit UvrC [Fangia hongkongensis]MBK2126333.1 excinuclease ABC subunit UvrC [Fangia hongkongensis]